MAIDLRQERQEQERLQDRRTASPPASNRPHGTVWMVVVALVAVLGVGTAVTVVALQDEPAPTGAVTTVSYPEGAFTAEREGGVSMVVPEPVAGYADTEVQIREGGPYGLTAGYVDTEVQIREG
jgi:hypothetical protein